MKNLLLVFSLLCIGLSAVFAQNITITPFLDATYTLRVTDLPTLKPRPGAREIPSWGFLWEYGDGHYGTDPQAYHAFQQKGPCAVRVYLTPKYASNKPLLIELPTPFSPAKLGPKEKARPGGPLVKIRTNQELVPNQDMRVVLHYKAPEQAIAGGHMVLFYNLRDQSGLSYKPFRFEKEETRAYYGESIRDSLPTEIKNHPDPSLQEHLSNSDYQVFRIEEMQANVEQRLFVTIHGYEDLLKVPGKKLSYVAMWLPDGVVFDPDEMVAIHHMKVQKAHDPNYIRVEPEQVKLVPGMPDKLTYTVRFFNAGRDEATKVRVFVPLDRGLDFSSLRVHSAQIGVDACDTCVLGEERLGCLSWQVMPDTLRGNGKDSAVLFTFHDVFLAGTKGRLTRKDSKGEFLFSIYTKGLKRDLVKARGFIVFNQGKTERTNIAYTRFVRQGFGVRAGLTFPGNLSETFFSTGPQPHIGLTYNQNPINTGLSKGLGLTYQPFMFDRVLSQSIPEGTIETFTVVRLRYLDLDAQVHYRLGRVFSVGGGVGVGLPLSAVVEERATAHDVGGFLVDETEAKQTFGVLGNSANNVDSLTLAQIGYSAQIGTRSLSPAYLGFVEVSALGVNSGLSVALRLNLRTQPKLYTGENLGFFFTQLSLNYKL